MRRLLVRRGRLRIPVSLHEHKTCRIVLLLGDIEPRDTRLPRALARIGKRRLFKRFHTLRLYVNMNVNNQHIR